MGSDDSTSPPVSSEGHVSVAPQNVDVSAVGECVDRATCCALAQATDPSAPLLKKGSKGVSVTALQGMLKVLPAHLHIAADGDFGRKTRNEVKDFQKANPSAGTADGIVGTNTWKALCAVVTAR